MNIRKASPIVASLFVLLSIASFFNANATPAFARKEKKACAYCHLSVQGGGKRGFRGIYYKEHHLSFKGFNEKLEAKKAGVKPGSMGPKTAPTKPYGNFPFSKHD